MTHDRMGQDMISDGLIRIITDEYADYATHSSHAVARTSFARCAARSL